MFSPIHHQFGPLANRQQCLRAMAMLFTPWRWRHGRSSTILAEQLSKAFGGEAFLFSSGREGLFVCLRAINLKQDDEVIVQGFTCIAVPNAVHAAGGRSVFVDIDPETLNLDCEEVKRAITLKTRAVICQHTFGIPTDTQRLRSICNEHHLLLIEDCAHIVPDETGPQDISRQGDALLLSFGRDKAISGVTGGAIIARNPAIAHALKPLWLQTGHLPFFTIVRLLLYPLFYAVARPLYGLFLGKMILKIAQMLHLFVPIYIHDEKEGHMPPIFHAIPNACAFLALAQWHRLREFNDHRRALTRFYLEEGKKRAWLKPLAGITPDLPLQKFPIFVQGADGLRKALKKRNIHLDDGWTGCVICPRSANAASAHYQPGSDPHAEAVGKQILCLPTHPGMTIKQAQRLMGEMDALFLWERKNGRERENENDGEREGSAERSTTPRCRSHPRSSC